jgi:hypothetical protein
LYKTCSIPTSLYQNEFSIFPPRPSIRNHSIIPGPRPSSSCSCSSSSNGWEETWLEGSDLKKFVGIQSGTIDPTRPPQAVPVLPQAAPVDMRTHGVVLGDERPDIPRQNGVSNGLGRPETAFEEFERKRREQPASYATGYRPTTLAQREQKAKADALKVSNEAK